jgi:hypothetical protein
LNYSRIVEKILTYPPEGIFMKMITQLALCSIVIASAAQAGQVTVQTAASELSQVVSQKTYYGVTTQPHQTYTANSIEPVGSVCSVEIYQLSSGGASIFVDDRNSTYGTASYIEIAFGAYTGDASIRTASINDSTTASQKLALAIQIYSPAIRGGDASGPAVTSYENIAISSDGVVSATRQDVSGRDVSTSVPVECKINL